MHTHHSIARETFDVRNNYIYIYINIYIYIRVYQLPLSVTDFHINFIGDVFQPN